MTEALSEKRNGDYTVPATIALFAVMIILGFTAYYYVGSADRPQWGPCDEAIKETLKAPSTYKRIDGPNTYQSSPQHFTISYDADNPYGVPIRGKGFCDIDPASGKATWSELR
jgi:hypothetical protein